MTIETAALSLESTGTNVSTTVPESNDRSRLPKIHTEDNMTVDEEEEEEGENENVVKIKFLFANHDGLNVVIEFDKSDTTVGDVKAALLSLWPRELLEVSQSDNKNGDDEEGVADDNNREERKEGDGSGLQATVGTADASAVLENKVEIPDGDRIRLICMGKGVLMPDSKLLCDCGIPSFDSHPTPVNVSIRPPNAVLAQSFAKAKNPLSGIGGADGVSSRCTCTIM